MVCHEIDNWYSDGMYHVLCKDCYCMHMFFSKALHSIIVLFLAATRFGTPPALCISFSSINRTELLLLRLKTKDSRCQMTLDEVMVALMKCHPRRKKTHCALCSALHFSLILSKTNCTAHILSSISN